MRKHLELMVGHRYEFVATIGKFGFTLGGKNKQQTILLLNIIRLDKLLIVTNHCWIVMQKSIQKIFKKLSIKRGQIIKFNSLVIEYTKSNKVDGVYIYTKDYKLDKLKNIRVVS